MVANSQQTPGGGDTEHRGLERCYVCARELSDEESLIVVDNDPVDFLEGPGVLKGYEIRCEACLALLPECPVCEGPMNECPTCGAHYCRRHAMAFSDSADDPTVPPAASLCDSCSAIHAEMNRFGDR